jgi:ABC-type glycerol-3-phosphate transport system substrate-binding protein
MMGLFLNGQAAMINEGNWSYNVFKEAEDENPDIFRLGFLPYWQIPDAPGEARSVSAPGNGLAIYVDSAYPAESLLLLDYLTRPAWTSQVCQWHQAALSPFVEADCPAASPFDDIMATYFKTGFVFPGWQRGGMLDEQYWCEAVVPLAAGEEGDLEANLAMTEEWAEANVRSAT